MSGFVRSARALPVITTESDLKSFLANWKSTIRQTLLVPSSPPCPFNFAATPTASTIVLSWAKVNYIANGKTVANGPDGYEILKSVSGDFVSDLVVIPIRDINQTNYTDTLTGTASYRIHTTAGTNNKPHSIAGPDSGVVSTSTGGSAATDTFTNDQTRARASKGRYKDTL